MAVRGTRGVEIHGLAVCRGVRRGTQYREDTIVINRQRGGCRIRESKAIGHPQANRVARQSGRRIGRIGRAQSNQRGPVDEPDVSGGIAKRTIVVQIPLVRDDTIAADVVRVIGTTSVKRKAVTHVDHIRTADVGNRGLVTQTDVDHRGRHGGLRCGVVIRHAEGHGVLAKQRVIVSRRFARRIHVERCPVVVEVPFIAGDGPVRTAVPRSGGVEAYGLAVCRGVRRGVE